MSAAAPALAVGVFPAATANRLQRLLGALEEAFPVRFEGRRDGELRDLDAVLEVGGSGQGEAAAAAGLPALSLLIEESAGGAVNVDNAMAADARLGCLRGTTLPDGRLGAALGAGGALGSRGQAAVLASCRERPTWVRADAHQTALLAPADLGPDEALRERLRDGRSAALLPLVHFLRELTAPIAWQPPPPRACFLFDDPNLHWPSYGFVRLGALSRHAREHGYHAALATVPLDGWFGHPAAVRALREADGALSLVVHGNDHYGAELEAIESEKQALSLAAQALRRTRSFERRHGVPVEPVMVPPHEECSQATMRALRRCGFEAITMTRPFPWLAPQPRSWLTRPPAVGPLAGWGPSDRTEGLAVFLRHPFVDRSPAELALRAFLGQPLILYGHQADLRGGLGVLGEAAADVNRLGPTQWCSLGEIAASSYESRRQGEALAVRPHGHRALLAVPGDVEELLVDPRADGTGAVANRLLVDGQSHPLDQTVPVTPGATVELVLGHDDEVDPSTVSPPRRQPLALPRRVLSEGRDRLTPLLARAR
jgi:hypothetical protein